jgi:hypothetical protein
VDFCGSTLDGIKGFGVDQIRSAVKTHNFALVILAAACVGLGLHLAATSIPAYLFMGVFTGAVIHLAKDEIYSQISEKWAMKRWTELALSTISLGVTVWYLPMTSVCTAVTILCSDPYMISNAIRNLQPPKK